MPKISIIIPVYNVEKYLRRCIESILSQSINDFEVILVNDGSSDQSGSIADEYKSKANDQRIIVIHKENGGVSSARNAGLSVASGDYVWFVDGDDWIEPNALEEILSEIENLEVDLVVFGNARVGKNIRLVNSLTLNKPGLYNFEILDFYKNYYFSNKVGFVPWNKIYRREVIRNNHILFDTEEAFGEDLLFNLYFYLNINTICFSNGVYYNYYVREGSAERTPSKQRHIQQMRIFEKYINYVQIKNLSQEIKDDILPVLFFRHLVSGVNQSKKAGIKSHELRSFLKTINQKKSFCSIFNTLSVKKAINKWFEVENVSLLSRIKFNMFLFFFKAKMYRMAALIIIS
jgi:glycosyltransferase involved in cell wall biosynthesis